MRRGEERGGDEGGRKDGKRGKWRNWEEMEIIRERMREEIAR